MGCPHVEELPDEEDAWYLALVPLWASLGVLLMVVMIYFAWLYGRRRRVKILIEEEPIYVGTRGRAIMRHGRK
jgi:hypothetical protein